MTTPVEHSDFGPSQWHRLLRCPAALEAERPFPNTAGIEAAEGTVFHEMVSDCLEFGLRPQDWLGYRMKVDGFVIEVDQDMVDFSEDGLFYVRHLMEDPETTVYVEKRVDISPWVGKGQFGTADVTAVNRVNRWIKNFDWKYGMEPVYPEENDQLYGYSLGFWESYGRHVFENDPSGIEVEFIIEQPRVPGAGGRWKTTMSRVLEFGEYAKRQALKARESNPPFVPGTKQCRWCRARSTCGAHAEYILDVMGSRFADIDYSIETDEPWTLPEIVTPERRSFILKNRPMITRFLDDLHASAFQDAKLGREVPGFVLVPGRRPARAWKPQAEHKVEAKLKSLVKEGSIYKISVISPAEAEKAVGKKVFSEHLGRFVEQGAAKPILADAKDTREPVETVHDRLMRYLEGT